MFRKGQHVFITATPKKILRRFMTKACPWAASGIQAKANLKRAAVSFAGYLENQAREGEEGAAVRSH